MEPNVNPQTKKIDSAWKKEFGKNQDSEPRMSKQHGQFGAEPAAKTRVDTILGQLEGGNKN